MALFDKIRGKNTILEPNEVPEYKAQVSDEEMKIMRHEYIVPKEPQTKEEKELEIIESILASPRHAKKNNNPLIEEKKEEEILAHNIILIKD